MAYAPQLSPNALQRQLAIFQRLPAIVSQPLISFALGQVVPMVGASGLRFDHVSVERVVVSLKNRRRVRNHIKGIHAGAMALLAETATGFCVGMHLPDNKLPLIKSMHIDYKRRAHGAMRAEAHLSAEQIQRIMRDDKGDVTVPVLITDSSGQSPIEAQMVWAWVLKTAKK